MTAKQDLTYTRTPAALEQKYSFNKSFAEVVGLANDARTAAEEAKNAAAEVGRKLTTDEIFNILTDNGTKQGIYKGEDGEIYVNGEYIKAGTLAADVVKLSKASSFAIESLDELNSLIEEEVQSMEVYTQKTLYAILDMTWDGYEDLNMSSGVLTITVGRDADSTICVHAIYESCGYRMSLEGYSLDEGDSYFWQNWKKIGA